MSTCLVCLTIKLLIHTVSTAWFSVISFLYMQVDLISPRTTAQNLVWTCLNKVVEPMLNCWPVNKLRDIALKNIMKHIYYEDEISKYICVCPINKVYSWNIGVFWVADLTKNRGTFCYYLTRPSFWQMQNFLFGPRHMLNLPDLVNSIISTIIFD